MPFIYPLELRVGDKVVLRDEDSTWTEDVTALSERQGERVFVYTDKRLLQCDPGLKLQISVRRGPLVIGEGDKIQKPEEK